MAILSTSDLVSPGLTAGDLMTVPVGGEEYTASRIASSVDLGKVTFMNSGSANTFTVPSDADLAMQMGKGASIRHAFGVAQIGAGTTTIAPASGVTLLNGASVDIAGQYNAVVVIRYRPNTWLVLGSIAA